MKRKLIFIAGFFSSALLSVIIFLFYSFHLFNEKNDRIIRKSTDVSRSMVAFKALPKARDTMDITVIGSDMRVDVLENMFAKYQSPLLSYSEKIVEVSDKYHVDYRLLPAIAMQESTLCKKIPKDSHNCWGYGIYAGNILRFPDYGQAIETITKNLAHEYIAKGYQNPYEMMKKYTPSSNGSWADNVSWFMNQLKISL